MQILSKQLTHCQQSQNGRHWFLHFLEQQQGSPWECVPRDQQTTNLSDKPTHVLTRKSYTSTGKKEKKVKKKKKV